MSKPSRALPKIIRGLRLVLSHSMIRPYWQRERVSITPRLQPYHHAIWYSTADHKIGEQRLFLKNCWMSVIYKLSQNSRISDEGKLIFKQAILRGGFVQIIDYFHFFKNRVRDKQVFKEINRKRVNILSLSWNVHTHPFAPTYTVHGERLLKKHTGIYCGLISIAKWNAILFLLSRGCTLTDELNFLYICLAPFFRK